MATTEELLAAYVRALEEKGYSPKLILKLEADCLNAESEMRKKRDRDLEDIEIAKLIPRGVDACLERFGGSRRNVFYRAETGRALLKRVQPA